MQALQDPPFVWQHHYSDDMCMNIDNYDDELPDNEGAGLFGPLPVMDGQPRTHSVRRLQLFQAEESLT